MRPLRAPRTSTDRRIAWLIFLAAIVVACGTAPGFTLLPGQLPSPRSSASAVPAGSPAASPAPSTSPGPSSSAGGSPGPSSSPAASGTSYSLVKKEKCPESRFECVTLSIPRDHTAAAGPNWDLTFAIQRATGTKLGTFVTVTGGPGYSGLDASESYTDGYDATIPEHYDMVFFDQRGIGLSHPIQCPSATAVYYADTSDTADPAQRAAVATAATTYVDACMTESKADPADLPYYATSQAIEDLEAFRDYLGADQLMLYGESYGTQYVQTYAATHPDRIKALFLDGPVDLGLDAISYYTEGARAFDDVLHDTLQACRAGAACRADIAGGDPLAAYDALAAKLDAGPISYRFPTAKGTFVGRELTLTDLKNLAYAYAYSPDDRSQFLRDLAAATHGDYVPMARAAYDSIVVDPETLEAIPDPTYSDAMYYATECQDYAFYLGRGSPEARLNAWLDAGERLGINKLRLGSTFYGDIPCVFWPAQPKADTRPKPIVDPPYPTFIMTATADVATPIANAMRLFGRLTDAYLLEAIGGDHVIFGRGDECPDRIITDYLVSASLPATRVITCPNVIIDEYVPTARAGAANYRDALALMSAMEDQITNSDDYTYRLDADPITMGCDLGGTLTYRPVDGGTQLTVKGCTFTRGAPMTGGGRIDDDAGTFRLTVRLYGRNRLAYFDDANGVKSVKGIFRGKPVDLKR